MLKELPEDFGEMKQLKHLDLYSNQITHLPLSFCELKNLRWLDLKNNPLVPAVAKIVGPCLDAQQCQQSARATVQFMTEMKQQVEEEKERLRQQELKDLEAQQEKEKQQKKRNDRKKAAKAKKKEMNNKKESDKEMKMNNQQKEEKTNNVNSKKEEINKKKKVTKKKSSLSIWLILFLTLPSILTLLFLLSASNAFGPKTEIYRAQVIDTWNNLLQKLPPQAQDWGNHAGLWIEQAHTVMGIQIENICDYLTEVSESEQAQQIKITLIETWHTVYNQSSIYLRTFVEKVSMATNEIMKKMS